MGIRAALGMPGLILTATYIGFGSLARESGFTLWQGVLSTATGWAAPGQIIMAELYAVGASLFAITLAVAFTNARLLPMTVVLMPHLRDRTVPLWAYYFAAHYIAVTGWAQAMRVCPTLSSEERLPYFLGCAISLWIATLIATTFGFVIAGHVPVIISTGLVFLNPVYFMLVLMVDLRERIRAIAIVLGAILGPALHYLSPDWGLLATGLIGGTAAFLVGRKSGPV